MRDDDAIYHFSYALTLLPPGRIGFRRWRWELWQGAHLLAAGWRLSRQHAERALRAAASRAGHQRRGLHPLDPERNEARGPFLDGAVVQVDCGALTCVLMPRSADRTLAALALGA